MADVELDDEESLDDELDEVDDVLVELELPESEELEDAAGVLLLAAARESVR